MRAYLATVTKALMGGAVAALGAGVTATLADDQVSTGEWWAIAAAGAGAAYAVWQTPDARSTYQGEHRTPEQT